MKKPFMAAIVALLLVSLLSCAGGAPTGTAPASRQADAPSAAPDAPPPPPLFTGDGGSGISLAVLVPEGTNLPAEQNYLPTLVQGVLVGDLTRFSAISVLDRMSLESVLMETESGIYRNEADFGQLGEIANVDYALLGNITRTGAGFAMQIQVVGTGQDTIGVTRASYSGNFAIAELDDFTGIRRASLDLLAQMGVNLTDGARQELSGAGTAAYVNAQTALAQGIVAQRAGDTIETMARFFEAAALDPGFSEAAARANTMSATVRTGNIWQDLRNDLAWRDEWRKLIADARDWFRSQPVPLFTELLYDPELEMFYIDYRDDQVYFKFWARLENYFPSVPEYIQRVENDLRYGLEATGRNHDWRLSVPQFSFRTHANQIYIFDAELLNDEGRVIGRDINNSFSPHRLFSDLQIGSEPNLGGISRDISGNFENYNSRIFIPDFQTPFSNSFTASYWLTPIFRVSVRDITDVMTIRISTIYEFTYPTSGPWRVTRIGQDLIPVRTTVFSVSKPAFSGWNLYGALPNYPPGWSIREQVLREYRR